jgi:hypothetical protein
MQLDKFYTKPEVVDICYKAIKKNLDINKNDLIIEPSAGNGAFLSSIKKLSINNKFFDIRPEHNEIHKQNFLKYKENSDDKKLHIIGNPPFGNKGSNAIKFIKHSSLLNAQSISFILPISFKKDSFRKSFPLQYHLIYEERLPENAFIYEESTKNIKTVFQIWVKKSYNRREGTKEKPKEWYTFVKKPECDLTIRRVGFSVGRIKPCSINDNINTNWFIKLNKKVSLDKLNKFKYDKRNNIGAYSISKQDIIKNFNKIKI